MAKAKAKSTEPKKDTPRADSKAKTAEEIQLKLSEKDLQLEQMRRQIEAKPVDVLRQVEKVHHEPRPDDRDDAEIDQSGKERQPAGKQPEIPAVSHLEKLPQGERPRP